MTESEAKTKWCPMRRLTEIGNIRINNTEPGTFTLNCIGSACMMWRTTGSDPYNKDGTPGRHGQDESKFIRILVGYCGLAGKP